MAVGKRNKGKNPIPGGEAGLYTGLTTIIKPVTIIKSVTKKRRVKPRAPHPWVPWNRMCQYLRLIGMRHPCHQNNKP